MNKLFRLIVDNKADKPRPFNLAKNGDTASLYIYDVISADWGVSALSVIEAINQAGDVFPRVVGELEADPHQPVELLYGIERFVVGWC